MPLSNMHRLRENTAAMQDILVKAKKMHYLLDYLSHIGANAQEVARAAGIDYEKLVAADTNRDVSVRAYSRLYRESVSAMQRIDSAVPWAAGVGSEAFELMCHCLIGCNTLAEALQRSVRFESLFSPISGRTLTLEVSGSEARIGYHLDLSRISAKLVPTTWSRADTADTVSKSSGLLVWHAFCGWLIGRSIDALRCTVAAPTIGVDYENSLAEVLGCEVEFDAAQSELVLPREVLDYRLVHTEESLREFLDNMVYELVVIEKKPSSTSAAIKSLVGVDFKQGMPTFVELARRLHMSESSLRRRLLMEKTSYQILKDEVRCSSAIEHLRKGDIKITELSDLLGYAEPSSFVRSFRNWTGMTPKAYSEQLLSKSAQM